VFSRKDKTAEDASSDVKDAVDTASSTDSTDSTDEADVSKPKTRAEARASQPKGQPTRKRSAAEAANKRPLVPGDRQAQARDMRSRNKDQRRAAMEGMSRGEDKYLAARDKGPQRRFVRDWIDARRNLAEYFLPIAILFLVAQFILMGLGPVAATVILLALYTIVVLAVIDVFVMWRGCKKALIAKFGEGDKGTAFYAAMRTFQLRRMRIPKPLHKEHGHWPS
jgi:hypothetical protein